MISQSYDFSSITRWMLLLVHFVAWEPPWDTYHQDRITRTTKPPLILLWVHVALRERVPYKPVCLRTSSHSLSFLQPIWILNLLPRVYSLSSDIAGILTKTFHPQSLLLLLITGKLLECDFSCSRCSVDALYLLWHRICPSYPELAIWLSILSTWQHILSMCQKGHIGKIMLSKMSTSNQYCLTIFKSTYKIRKH